LVSRTDRAIFLINGTQGAGKSTVARLLAKRFDCGVSIDADELLRLIVSGAAPIESPLSAEAERQLRLRACIASQLADTFFEAGFTVVIAEIFAGRLDHFCAEIKSRPLLLVNLAPSLDIVRRRNEERPNKNVYEPWSPILDRAMRETMSGIGLWIDNSNQSPAETVDEILQRAWKEGSLG
jgi:tRNA uridine 5-carbamoylmethylation protein Kti12